MAFLKKTLRVWSRTVRLLSTETVASKETEDPFKNGARPKHSLSFTERKANQVLAANFNFNKWLDEDRNITHEECAQARKEFLESKILDINEIMVDNLIITMCLQKKKLNIGLTYLEHLWEKPTKMKLVPMLLYFSLCHKSQQITDKQKKILLEMYDTIRRKYPVLDARTGYYMILGITLTERWKEAMEIAKLMELTDSTKHFSQISIVRAAFDNDEPEIGWKCLKELAGIMRIVHVGTQLFPKYLDYCVRHFKGQEFDDEIEKMLQFWHDANVYPTFDMISSYQEVLKKSGWVCKPTRIINSGTCQTCHRRLNSFTMSADEHAKLTKLVHDRVAVGDDIYKKSSPTEWATFLRFIKKRGPWDIVVDGLNVAYIAGQGKVKSDTVTEIVKACVALNKKTLLLGRAHMKKWTHFRPGYLNRIADVFLAENLTADDIFLLYAAISSGPYTMFVSNDLMRQHKHQLADPEVANIFYNWQLTHQIYSTARSRKFPESGLEVTLKMPPKYLPFIQRNSDFWHIPYVHELADEIPTGYEIEKSWVCWQRPKV